MSDWYFEVNAGDIPTNHFGEKGMNAIVWTYAIGGFAGFWFILALAIHTIYYLIQSQKIENKDESRYGKVRTKFLFAELSIQVMFMMACIGLALGRSDAFIKGDFTEIGCYIGFYFEICVYGLGKCASYLLFAFRVKYAFEGSVFAVNGWLKLVLLCGTTIYMINNIMAFLALPIEHTKWAWVHAGNVKMCVIPQHPTPFITPLTLKLFPVLDMLLCGSLCFFFMYRLKAIRTLVIEISARQETYKITVSDHGSAHKISNEVALEMSCQTQPTYISTTTSAPSVTQKPTVDKHLHVEKSKPAPVPMPDKSFAAKLQLLMWKQSILIAITLFTTLCTTAWVYVLPMLTNLLVFDCIMNAICNHLMFSFCNSFWTFVQSKMCSKRK